MGTLELSLACHSRCPIASCRVLIAIAAACLCYSSTVLIAKPHRVVFCFNLAVSASLKISSGRQVRTAHMSISTNRILSGESSLTFIHIVRDIHTLVVFVPAGIGTRGEDEMLIEWRCVEVSSGEWDPTTRVKEVHYRGIYSLQTIRPSIHPILSPRYTYNSSMRLSINRRS